MLEIFSHTKSHFIGIDFGTSAIKVVELSYKDQKVHLENYGIVDLNWVNRTDNKDDKMSQRGASFEQKLNTSLKELLFKMGIKGGDVCVSIPGFNGLITIIELPEMENEDLAKAIQFEAHKYIPSSLDEVAMSWEIIEHVNESGQPAGTPEAPKKIKVLLVAAPKKDIEHYDNLVLGTGLTVSAIELETFSITRALTDETLGNYFIIDIGSRATNIILVEKGVISVNRNLDAGGNEVTTALEESMGVSRTRAENFKKGDKDFLNDTQAPMMIPVLELIIGEARRILNTYKTQKPQVPINEIIISGGSAELKGLNEYFSKSLGVKVSSGNPWRKIEYTQELKPLVEQLGSSFTVAIGLALRGIEEYKRK